MTENAERRPGREGGAHRSDWDRIVENDSTTTPRLGTIEWARRWRVLHPSGVEWPPLIAAEMRWERAVADTEKGV